MSPRHQRRSARHHLPQGAHARTNGRTSPSATALLMAVYDLMRMGPTSANISPARIRVRRVAGSERAAEAASVRRQSRTRRWPRPRPRSSATISNFAGAHAEAVSACARREGLVQAIPKLPSVTAFRNGTLAGRVFHHRGARAGTRLRPDVGLRQCGRRSRILCRHARSNRISSAASATGDPSGVFPRSPRLPFDEACKISEC